MGLKVRLQRPSRGWWARRPHLLIHLSAQSAFFATHGMVSTARNRWSFCTGSLMYVSNSRLYISVADQDGGQKQCSGCIGCATFLACVDHSLV